jgi:hypothetical protein
MKIRWDLFRDLFVLLLILGGIGVLVSAAWIFSFVLGLVALGLAMLVCGLSMEFLMESGGKKE